MEITIKINISQDAIDTLRTIRSKPWTQVTEEERKQYEHLMGMLATALSKKILDRKN